MGARVTWRDAQGQSGVVELSYPEIFIGRSMECAIRTDDPMVSRRHARIHFQDGRHVIEDLGSANGIFVGEQRTQMHVFGNGDSVRCGNVWVQYASDGPMASPGGFGPGGTAMVQPGQGFGSPPPVYGGALASPMGGGGPPPMGGMGSGAGAAVPQSFESGASPAEWQRMQRRVDQLQSEVRLLRGGGANAATLEELEDKVSRLERDKNELMERNFKLENMARQGSGGVQIGTAQLMLGRAEEVVNGLNDVLSELRINILAAEGEAEQWQQSLPRASFDLVRDSLRSSKMQMETAKELMRLLRAEGR